MRGAFLKNWSANKDSDLILDVLFLIEDRFAVPVWIERVGSQSNPADVLSREVVTTRGTARHDSVDVRELWCLVADVADSTREVGQPIPGEKRGCEH